MLSASHRWARSGWELPQPNRDGPHLPIGSLDPGRSPAGHHHLPHRGVTYQQEKEVGADVLLQRTKEGEKRSVNHVNRLIIFKRWLKMLLDLSASATCSTKAVMTLRLMPFPLCPALLTGTRSRPSWGSTTRPWNEIVAPKDPKFVKRVLSEQTSARWKKLERIHLTWVMASRARRAAVEEVLRSFA